MADNALLASLLMGQKRRTDPLEDQRKYGQSLMQQGSSTAPVLSPWEGVARALQGGLGGAMAGYSDMQEKEQDAGNITALSKAATETTPEGIARALQGVKGNSEMMIPVLGQIIQGRLDKAQKDDVARGGLDAGLGAFGIQPGAGPSGQGGYQPTLGRYESGNNPQAVNPASGAGGEYQFLRPTWNDTRANNPDLNLPPTVLQASQEQQAAAEQRLRQQNAVELQKFGIEPTPANLYLAHRAGAQGARTILSASPDAPLSIVVPPEWIAQNPDMRTTVGQFVQMAGQRFPSGQGAQPQAPQGQPASSTQSAPANAPQPQQPQLSPAAAQYLQQAQSLRDRDPVRANELVKDAAKAQAAYETTIETRQYEASRDAMLNAEKRRLDAIEHDRREGNKPATAEQALSGGFSDRMQNSNALVEKFGQAGTSFARRIRENLPMGIGNAGQSAEYQQYKQARDDFINAQLRRESGAAIAPSEYANADKQYFPQPGDKPEVIEQKALNRRLAVEGMVRNAGQSYKPSPSVNATAPQRGADAPAPAGGIAKIANDAEYDELPSGKQYVGPDGQTRTKR